MRTVAAMRGARFGIPGIAPQGAMMADIVDPAIHPPVEPCFPL
jgi:hypothetical protein